MMAEVGNTTSSADGTRTPERDKDVKSPEGTPLRRSTRASAMRATEKLRGNESTKEFLSTTGSSGKNNSEFGSDEDIPDDSEHFTEQKNESITAESKKASKTDEPAAKKRRLADPRFLDPTDPHFAIQQTEDGQVVVLSDDSEVSSLNDDELSFIRKNYEKELTDEVREERQRMIRKLKAELRCEEAKLVYLKKLRLSQQTPIVREPVQAHGQTGPVSRPGPMPALRPAAVSAAAQNTHYKPHVAGVQTHPSPQSVRQPFVQVNGQRMPPPLQHLRNTAPRGPATVHHASQSSRPAAVQPSPAHQSTKPHLPVSAHVQNVGRSSASNNAATSANLAKSAAAAALSAAQEAQNAAQKQAAAKLALRKQLEKTLLQIPPPKPPPPEMHFVPNPNQLDFVYLVGLDYIVQRLEETKRDKDSRRIAKEAASAEAKPESSAEAGEQQNSASAAGESATETTTGAAVPKISVDAEPPPPFSCNQCGTDFTTLWKSVPDASKPEKQNIMCETCVRTNQKKALKMEHTNRLKQAFVKALQQEQEIEQKIKDGTFATSDSPSNTTTVVSSKVNSGSHAHASAGSSVSGAASQPMVAAQQSSSRVFQQAQSQSQAAAVAAAAAATAVSFPSSLQASMFGLQASMFGWNPLFAAAAARFPTGFTNPTANLFPNLQNLPKDFLKNLQQQSAAMQRQILMDLMPRPKQFK